MTVQGRQQTTEVSQDIRKQIEIAEKRRREARFEHSLEAFLGGNSSVLKSGEFVQDLTNLLVTDPDEDRARKKQCLLALQGGGLVDDREIRERVLTISAVTSLHFLRYEDFEFLSILVDGLLLWLEMEKNVVPGQEQIFKRLKESVKLQIRHGRLGDSLRIVRSLRKIQQKPDSRHRSYASLSGKVLKDLAVPDELEPLCNIALVRDEDFPDAREILLLLGQPSVEYLFNRLVESPSKKERLKLIPLIAEFNGQAVDLLEKKLQFKPVWSETRNILVILGEIGHPRSLAPIRSCLSHPDKRVRIQALDCLRKIGGEDVKHELMLGLREADDGLKVQIIRSLVEDFGNDDDVFETLVGLAEKRASFGASSGRKLLHGIIGGLKSFPREASVNLLRRMREEYTAIPGQEEIVFLVDQSLHRLEPMLRRQKADTSGDEAELSFDFDPAAQQSAFHCWKEIEPEIERLMDRQLIDEATAVIRKRALKAISDREFGGAELLRDRILEINPMALEDALELGELLEKKKGEDISDYYYSIWSELYQLLGEEEFRALYFRCSQESYGPGERIVRVGDMNSSLYFLNSGQIHLSCQDGPQEVFLKKLLPGDVSGWEPLFSASVWTVSLTAKSFVQLQVLDQENLQELEAEYPGISETIEQFCRQRTRVPELLKMSGRDRRDEPRYSVTLVARNMLLDEYGNKGKRSFAGALVDISRTGLAFTIGISSDQNARALLGRNIISILDVPGEEELHCKGAIVGVRKRRVDGREFTVHVRLAQRIENRIFESIVASGV